MTRLFILPLLSVSVSLCLIGVAKKHQGPLTVSYPRHLLAFRKSIIPASSICFLALGLTGTNVLCSIKTSLLWRLFLLILDFVYIHRLIGIFRLYLWQNSKGNLQFVALLAEHSL